MEKYYEKYCGKVVVVSVFDKSRYKFLIKSARDESFAEGPVEVNLLGQATSF